MNTNKTSPTLRILLVEDDEHDRLAFRRAFQKSQVSCQITECGRAEKALERLRDDSSSFDLLVIDHGLPGMSGLDLCMELIKKETPWALVLLTGMGSEELAIEALKVGVDDYLIKDPDRGYLALLPVVLTDVLQKHNDRLAHKRSEEALRASEEKYRAVVENASEGIIVVQDGMLKFVNAKMLEIMGYSTEELTSRPFVEFIHPDHKEMVFELHPRRLKREELPHIYTVKIIDQHGHLKWLEIEFPQ
jgi:PAS domain S-box-containing protein